MAMVKKIGFIMVCAIAAIVIAKRLPYVKNYV